METETKVAENKETDEKAAKPPRAPYYKIIIAGIVVLLLIGGGIFGIYLSKARKNMEETTRRANELKQGPLVKTVVASASAGIKDIVLIGEARPYQTATLYAKIGGYLDKINVDKGDKVTEGELLAYVDNPEINQQYDAALSNLENLKKIAARDKDLLAKKFISQEAADLSQTNVEVAQANLKSLDEQRQFQYLKAPFTGTVTARFVDQGALIQNAINGQTSSQPVVTLAELSRLRIYIYVEQKDAIYLKIGYPVEITLTDRPEVNIKASVTRIAGELDPHTRMMLTEIDIPNKNDIILPGSYVQVHIKNPGDTASNKIVVPSVALVIHKNKMMVAIIDRDSTLHFKEVTIAHNNGDKVSISSGLSVGDRVALSVGESIIEGQKVRFTE